MPKITHVKEARPRYERVPVIDEATGEPKVVPVNRTTKRGTAVTMAVTRDDLDQPLPPHNCDYCRQPIAVGTPYKHISPRSGPFGGRTLRRHEGCPTWQPWDYSDSLSARLSQIAYEFDNAVSDATEPGEVESAQSEAADRARELAEEKRESAQNIEDGFQHPTAQSEELAEQADAIEEWANEIEGTSVPEFPEPEENDCETCDGTGRDGEAYPGRVPVDCDDCDGTGRVTPDDPTEDQVDEWRSEVESEFAVVGEPPV
jgi:hypothetical protein